MCIVGAWFGDFVELPELMDIALRLSWEQLEATNVAFCRSVERSAGQGDDETPGRCDGSIDHDPHR